MAAKAMTASGAKSATSRPKEFNFVWEGRDRAGKTLRGETRASGETIVVNTLRRQGIVVTRIKKQRYKAARGKIQDKDITLFTRQLATMMKAGVPLLQAFDIVAKGTDNGAVAKLFTDIKADVETGTALSQAFRKYPLYFDNLFCNLVGAGEQAGILDDLLDRLAMYKEKMEAIKAKIKSALFYPTAVMVVAFIVVAVIMLFVVPAFKSVFESFGADLPAPTLFVMALSDYFVQNWYIIFGGIGLGIYFFLLAVPRWGLTLPSFWMLTIPIVMCVSATTAEVFRSGVLALDRGQREAAWALGMGEGLTMRLVLAPQALRLMLPTLITQLVTILKNTSLGYVVAYGELMYSARLLSNSAQAAHRLDVYLPAYLIVALLFVTINWLLGAVARRVEARTR